MCQTGETHLNDRKSAVRSSAIARLNITLSFSRNLLMD
jgi:hypothetical protein